MHNGDSNKCVRESSRSDLVKYSFTNRYLIFNKHRDEYAIECLSPAPCVKRGIYVVIKTNAMAIIDRYITL